MSRDFSARVLPDVPVTALADADRPGEALDAARAVDPGAIIDLLDGSGLRGRGGAGFPAARKWRTVAANRTDVLPSTVVVNAAEGEPGSFKDRAILRADPYRVIEGALIAAHAVGADSVIVATKASFTREQERLQAAIDEIGRAGWTERVPVTLVTGPGEYLFGEETALLEVIDGRPPFPRIAPPYREGVDEVFEHRDDTASGTGSAAHVEMAGPGDATVAPPTLASNTETFANVPAIVRNGADWFRELGTPDSPGTVVCTVSGDTERAGVAEVELGTPLREVLEQLGGGARDGHELLAVMSGVANPLLPANAFDTPVSYEAMRAAGSGLGAAGFIVFDDATDLVAVAAGISRFLAVESCGQCRHCKDDGLALAALLAQLTASRAGERDVDEITHRLDFVAEGARCNLAAQQQVVVGSVLQQFPELVAAHVSGAAVAVEPVEIASIVDLVDGRVVLDDAQRTKQPDWTHDAVDSGQWPADRLDDHRAGTS
ncbi:MAG TPA: NADH-ubiquinone oxidoreductase-F iron-sulfur binding region domain-containing protein [Acidimicrobiia bacterium]|nr:NADH-ubiquinone oxidoreductase-F iron-sulfur binding region domain-containing protein [Acidimicrobiia bacterium]